MMDLAQVSEACSKLSLMLEQVLAYVDDVLAGKQLPDNQVNINIRLFFNVYYLDNTRNDSAISGRQSSFGYGTFRAEND